MFTPVFLVFPYIFQTNALVGMHVMISWTVAVVILEMLKFYISRSMWTSYCLKLVQNFIMIYKRSGGKHAFEIFMQSPLKIYLYVEGFKLLSTSL